MRQGRIIEAQGNFNKRTDLQRDICEEENFQSGLLRGHFSLRLLLGLAILKEATLVPYVHFPPHTPPRLRARGWDLRAPTA